MSTFGVFLVLLVATLTKNGNCDANSEANLLALATSGELLAPRSLTQKLAKELQAIRAAHPEVSNIIYSPPWVVGELIAQVSDEQLAQIRRQYGPVTSSPLFDNYKVLTFKRQYNPEVLANELNTKNLVTSAEPNNIIGGGSTIQYNASTGVYTFIQGWGDCPSGCINKHYWEFRVNRSGKVILVDEYGTPLGEGEGGAVEI